MSVGWAEALAAATAIACGLLIGIERGFDLRDLKPGTRVVSHSFDMGDWKPEKEDSVDGASIYLWTIPAKK